MKPIGFVLIIVAPFAAVTRTAESQSAAGQLAVGAGSATDERGVRADAVTLAPSVMFARGPNAGLVLGVTATRFSNAGWQLGAGTTYMARSMLPAGFALAVNGGGSVSRASFDATFAQGDATPALQWTAGPLTLIGGMHAAAGYTAVTAQTSPTLLPSTTQLVSVSRTSVAPSYGGELRFGDASPVSAVFSFREEPARVGGILVTDQLAGATMTLGTVTLSGLAGHRSAIDERVDFASGSVAIPVTSIVSLTMAGGRYPSNRLTGAAGGRFSSVGLSLRLGGPHELVPPQPSGVRPPAPALTRLTIRATSAARVEVAGDWNSWALSPAVRSSNGVWYVDVALQPGEYRYAFLVDGREWRAPEGVVAVDDGFGGKAAFVTVQAAASFSEKPNQEER